MARLPQPGSDNGTWGEVLNEFLSESHNADGSLKDVAQSKVTGLVSDLASKASASAIPTTPGQVGAEPAGLSNVTKTELNNTFATRDTIAPGVILHSSRGLRRWYSALGRALFETVNIVVLGDSITVGVGADGNPSGGPSPSHDATARPRGYVGQLRSRFANVYGDPGPGWLSPPDNGQRFTAGGGALYSAYGPYEQGFRLTANTQTVTVTIEACTEIDFWSWDGGSGTYSVSVDGGTAQTFSAGSGNINLRTWTKRTLASLSDAPHTVVFTGPSSGAAYFAGLAGRRQVKGVHVHRMARSGNTTNNVLGKDSVYSANPEAQARSLIGIGLVPDADLVIVALGTNDAGNQANADTTTQAQPGTTPANYEANVRQIVNQVVSTGASVLLLGPPRLSAETTPQPESAYRAALAKIAADTDHVAYLDIATAWGTHTEGNALGLYSASFSVHPSLAGHGEIADILFRALSRPSVQGI